MYNEYEFKIVTRNMREEADLTYTCFFFQCKNYRKQTERYLHDAFILLFQSDYSTQLIIAIESYLKNIDTVFCLYIFN